MEKFQKTGRTPVILTASIIATNSISPVILYGLIKHAIQYKKNQYLKNSNAKAQILKIVKYICYIKIIT